MRVIAYTFTCFKDSYLVGMLCKSMPKNIEWYVYAGIYGLEPNVEVLLNGSSNIKYYRADRLEDGTNGFGGTGTLMHLDILDKLKRDSGFTEEDVLIHLDSDTYINNTKIFEQAKSCKGIMGILNASSYAIDGGSFTWASGCCITIKGSVYSCIKNEDIKKNTLFLVSNGICPSNDVSLSYIGFKNGFEIKPYDISVGRYLENVDFVHDTSKDKRITARKLFYE